MPKVVPSKLLRNKVISVYLRASEKQLILSELELRGITARDVLLASLQQNKTNGECQ